MAQYFSLWRGRRGQNEEERYQSRLARFKNPQIARGNDTTTLPVPLETGQWWTSSKVDQSLLRIASESHKVTTKAAESAVQPRTTPQQPEHLFLHQILLLQAIADVMGLSQATG